MPETQLDSVAGEVQLQTVLLDAKVQIPSWRSGAVSRRGLITKAKDSGARVVSVYAPAGYGKSTMLAEWAASEKRHVAWVSLERTDADPATLLETIAFATSSLAPGVEAVVADMRGVGAFSLGRSAPLLAAALGSASSEFVLFLDDLHWVDSAGCQDALEMILASVPAGSQVVVAGRGESALIARLRASGDAWEIAAADLRMDAEGARAIFDQAGVDHVDEEDLGRIVERCEGWPTGLFLCALVARGGGDAASVVGDDRYLADYLYRECIARMPEATQEFLRRTAVFDRFSPASCNALLGIVDARARLHDIEAANLFLVPMDRNRGWFRYHALFREFLLTELERAEGADAVAELHRRAAAWHEENGAPAVAVEHLLQARDIPRAVALVAELGLPMYGQGQIMTVRRWFDELGDAVLRDSPQLVILMTWTVVLLGETRLGETWARALEQIDSSPFPEDARELFESARAMVRAAMCEHGHEQVVADAAYAMEHEPLTSSWRCQALHLWGSASLLVGDHAQAAVAFTEAVDVALVLGNSDTVILSEPELSLLAIERGDWAAAGTHARRGVDMIDAAHMDGYATTALALAVAARVALHEGDRGLGERLLARAMRARIGCTYLLPYLSVRVRLQLAKAHVAIGDRSAAFHLVREADEILHKRPDVGVIAVQVEEFRAGLAAEPSTGGSIPLTPAELRLLPYLQTHLTIAEIGQRLFVSRNTVSSQLGSIYRKLAVTTRGAAVERAAAIGLLGA